MHTFIKISISEKIFESNKATVPHLRAAHANFDLWLTTPTVFVSDLNFNFPDIVGMLGKYLKSSLER